MNVSVTNVMLYTISNRRSYVARTDANMLLRLHGHQDVWAFVLSHY